MSTHKQEANDTTEGQGGQQEAGTGPETPSSGDQLVEELGRLGRKLAEVLETAWNSDQRREIEQDLRKGLSRVAESLEAGLQTVSEKEETRRVLDKAETAADNLGDKARRSEVANELAVGLTKGLHALGDQLDRLAQEMRASQPGPGQTRSQSTSEQAPNSQDIPITDEEPKPPAGNSSETP